MLLGLVKISLACSEPFAKGGTFPGAQQQEGCSVCNSPERGPDCGIRSGTLYLLVLMITILGLCLPASTLFAVPDPLVDISPDPTYFNGSRRDPVVWDPPQPQPMLTWSIVAVVRPAASASGISMTVVTNDLAGWNDDVLFGICPEALAISPAWKWAIIGQDSTDADTARTKAVVAQQSTVGDTTYHIAATSDGEYLRFYVNGRLATCPTQRDGARLNFGDATTYIGGSAIGGGLRYFKGYITSVKIYDTALTDEEIAVLAIGEGLLDQATLGCRCYVDNIMVDSLRVRVVTSIDFVNGFEVVTDLAGDRFVYRPEGAIGWQASADLVPTPLDGQHSITWSDVVSPPRYFVADTGHHRIVSFEALSDSTVHSETDSIAGTCLWRPHDLEFNPADRYFYGITAPQPNTDSDSLPKALFRFSDIGVDEGILTMAPRGTPNSAFYMRSLSVIDDTVYVVNSFGADSRPQVFKINDFGAADTTIFTTHPSFAADLQDVDFHNGWWYGTGNIEIAKYVGPLLARWRTWADFQGGTWQNLSDLVYCHEDFAPVDSSHAYFLTHWNGRLFFTVYHDRRANKQDRIYEIVDPDSVPASVKVIPAGTSIPSLWSHPNPFNTTTEIRYTVPDDACVQLAIYDVSGRLVTTLVDQRQIAGDHAVVWEGRDPAHASTASGVYFVRLKVDGEVRTAKIILPR